MLTKPDPLSNPYQILGIAADADEAAIKKAYFTKVREHPPEREPVQFKKIRAAYDKVNALEKRLDTNMLLLQDWAEPEFSATLSLEPKITRADIIAAARAETDLGRTNWREDMREVTLKNG